MAWYLVASQDTWVMQWGITVSVLHQEKHQGSERSHRFGCKEGKETPECPSRKYISISHHVTPPTSSVTPERLGGRAPNHSNHSWCPWMPLDGTALGWDTWTSQSFCLLVCLFSSFLYWGLVIWGSLTHPIGSTHLDGQVYLLELFRV